MADARVLAAMAEVPRDRFVPPELRGRRGRTSRCRSAAGQTISQPLVVARMCELLELRGDETVLDVGTGSGYHAALLARLAAPRVLDRGARVAVARGGGEPRGGRRRRTSRSRSATARAGCPSTRRSTAINVAAAAGGAIPPALADQLAPGGRLVAPVEDGEQRLVVARRTPDGVTLHRLERVRFVPLVSVDRGSGAGSAGSSRPTLPPGRPS